MNFGCHLPTFGAMATREILLAFARRMEALGYTSLWASDHVVIPTNIASRYPYNEGGRLFIPAEAPLIEPITALTFVAAATERVQLGTSVLVLPHRHPLLTAKMLSGLDHLSGGRVVLGAGIGWMREEIEMLGAPFARRAAWSEEAIRILRACWREGKVQHRGEFFTFDEIGVFPVRTSWPLTSNASAQSAPGRDGASTSWPLRSDSAWHFGRLQRVRIASTSTAPPTRSSSGFTAIGPSGSRPSSWKRATATSMISSACTSASLGRSAPP